MSTEKTQSPEVIEMKKFVQSHGKPNDKKAWMGLAVSALYTVIGVLLINMNFSVFGWFLHTLNAMRLFVQFHDMAHFSYFSTMQMNIFIGKIIGIIVHFPFNAWRDGHNHHHKHFGNLDRLDLSQTILFTKKQYQNMNILLRIVIRIFRQPVIFFLITAPFIWFIALIVTVAKRYGVFSLSFVEKCLSLIIWTWIFPMIGISSFNAWMSLIVANVLGTALFHLQHSVNMPYRQRKDKWSFVKAALEGSTYLEIPYIFKTFTNGIQYHHIHHLNTMIPSYAIQQCHQEYQKQGKNQKKWDDFNINRVEIALALKSLMNVMLDQQNQQLIPFSYKHI